ERRLQRVGGLPRLPREHGRDALLDRLLRALRAGRPVLAVRGRRGLPARLRLLPVALRRQRVPAVVPRGRARLQLRRDLLLVHAADRHRRRAVRRLRLLTGDRARGRRPPEAARGAQRRPLNPIIPWMTDSLSSATRASSRRRSAQSSQTFTVFFPTFTLTS